MRLSFEGNNSQVKSKWPKTTPTSENSILPGYCRRAFFAHDRKHDMPSLSWQRCRMKVLRPHLSDSFSIPITSKWFQNRHACIPSPLVQFTSPAPCMRANMTCPIRYDRDVAWGRYHCKVVLESHGITESGLWTVVANMSMEKRYLNMCPIDLARACILASSHVSYDAQFYGRVYFRTKRSMWPRSHTLGIILGLSGV